MKATGSKASSEISSELPLSHSGSRRPGSCRSGVTAGLNASAAAAAADALDGELDMVLQQAGLGHQFNRFAAVQAGSINFGRIQIL